MRGRCSLVCVYFVLVERTVGGDVGHVGDVCGGGWGRGLKSISDISVKRVDIRNKVEAGQAAVKRRVVVRRYKDT
jgi:hypothetical protein